MRRLSLLVVASCMLALFFTVAAQAATPQVDRDPTSEPAPRGVTNPAPRCITAYVNSGRFVDSVVGSNDCGRTERVKVIVAFGPDSNCKVLFPGADYRHRWPSVGRFDGLQSC